MQEPGAAERAELFRLLPQLLRALPTINSHRALTPLYPALISAAGHDPRLTALTAISPLLAYVVAAAVEQPSGLARSAATALAQALVLREGTANVAATLLTDLVQILQTLKSLSGKQGQFAILEDFARAAIAAKDIVCGPVGSAGGGAAEGLFASTWPYVPILLDYRDELVSSVVSLVPCIIQSRLWIRIGAAARDRIARSIVRTGEKELLLCLKNPRKTGVPLPRPLLISVNNAIMVCRQNDTCPVREVGVGEPLRKRPRSRPSYQTQAATSPENIQSLLNAVSGMMWNEDACKHVASLCRATARVQDGEKRAALSKHILDTAMSLFAELVLSSDDESRELVIESSNCSMLRSVLELASTLLELASRPVNVSSPRTPESDLSLAMSSMPELSQPSASSIHRNSLLAGNGQECHAQVRLPFFKLTLLSVVSVLQAVIGATARSIKTRKEEEMLSSFRKTLSSVVIRAALLLWRVSDICSALKLDSNMTSPMSFNSGIVHPGEDSDTVNSLLSATIAVGALGSFCFDTALNLNADHFAEATGVLLRSGTRALACHAALSASAIESVVARLEAFSRDSLSATNYKLTESSILSLADLVCASASCRYCILRKCLLHVVEEQEWLLRDCEKKIPLSSPVWASLYEFVAPIVRQVGHSETVGAAARLLARLVTHASPSKFGSSAADLVQALWHPTSASAADESAIAIRSILCASQSRISDKVMPQVFSQSWSKGGPSASPLPSEKIVHLSEDTWDGPEAALRIDTGSEHDFIVKLLVTEIQSQLSHSGTVCRDPRPLSRLATVSVPSSCSASRVVAVANEALISAAVAELCDVLGNKGASTTSAENSFMPRMTAFTELIFSASICDTLSSHLGCASGSLRVGGEHRSSFSRNSAVDGSCMRAVMLLCENKSSVATSTTLTAVVSHYMISRYKLWIPVALPRLLKSEGYTERLTSLVGESSVDSLWQEVSKFALGPVLREGSEDTLGLLASRCGKASRELVEQVCSDALARGALLNFSSLEDNSGPCNKLIERVLQQPLSEVINTRLGKLVQRLVMEFGNGRDEAVLAALASLARVAQTAKSEKQMSAESVVTQHFLLVMDAINRGLFVSQLTRFERRRCLLALAAVVRLCRAHVHLFVPKVMATLKMTMEMEGTDQVFRETACSAWVSFMLSLGPHRLGPHFGSFLAILAPYLQHDHRILAPTLCELFVAGQNDFGDHVSDIALLVATISHFSLDPIAAALGHRLPRISCKNDANDEQRHGNQEGTNAGGDRIVLDKHFVSNVDQLLGIAMTHESDAIRELALDRMLTLLRKHRSGFYDEVTRSAALLCNDGRGLVPRMMRSLTNILHDSSLSCRAISSKCLGEIGALDPTHLLTPSEISHPAPHQNIRHKQFDFMTPETRKHPESIRIVALELLSHILVPALLRGDRTGTANLLNRLGFAIQEVLHVCGCEVATPKAAEKIASTASGSNETDDWESELETQDPCKLAAHFWARLLPEVQQAVQPYLAKPFDTATYTAIVRQNGSDFDKARVAEDALRSRGPVWARLASVFDDSQGARLREWRMQMTVQLSEFVGDRGKFGPLLQALRPVMRHVESVSLYLMPLVIREAVDLDVEFYCEREQKHALTRSERAAHLSKYCRFESNETVLFKFLHSEIVHALSAGGAAAQYLFTVLDTLRQWRDTRAAIVGRRRHAEERDQAVGVARRKLVSSEGEYIAKAVAEDVLTLFVDLEGRSKLSLLLLARAAYDSRAFSRAVLYAEQSIRSARKDLGAASWPAYVSRMVGGIRHDVKRSEPVVGGGLESSSAQHSASIVDENWVDIAAGFEPNHSADGLFLLQKCFFELEDCDSMSSVAILRVSTSLQQSILDCESSGSFDDALLGYERALATSSGDILLQNGFMRCLRTLGHWETMLAHADGIACSIASSDTVLDVSVKALGIEAAWRLGRWERVEQICASISMSLDDIARQSSVPTAIDRSACLLSGYDSWDTAFNIALGRMFLCIQHKDVACLERVASEARSCLLRPVENASMEGYDRVYPFIVRMHMLADIEDTSSLLGKSEAVDDRASTAGKSSPWKELCLGDKKQRRTTYDLVGFHERTSLTASSLHVREPILSCKRVCLELLGRHAEASAVCLQLAQTARESGNLRAAAAAAYRATLSAQSGDKEWFAASIESARIKAARGDMTSALLCLEKDIDRMTREMLVHSDVRNSDASSELTKAASKAKLANAHVLAGQWIEEARSAPSDAIVEHYKRAAKLCSHSDEPFYALGRFYHSLLVSQNSSASSSSRTKQEYVPLVIQHFAEALRLGHGHVFEILPRMLTVWFDFYTAVESNPNAFSDHDSERRVKRAIQQALPSIPKYMWMTVVPQLMSRLLHPSAFVRHELQGLLASIVMEYPDQSIWMIAPSSQLKSAERRGAAGDILNKSVQVARRKVSGRSAEEAKKHATELKRRIRDGLMVIKHLIDVCMTQPPKEKRGRTFCCAREFAPLRGDLQSSSVLVPTLASLTVSLPRGAPLQNQFLDAYKVNVNCSERSTPEYSAFSTEPVTIADIETTVLVMSSLMRPRRIGFVGSDGKVYRFLSKRETSGDMRKDSRLMEILTVVNRLLAKEPEAHRRELNLKTYAVIPLSEETGLLEWVNNIVPLRIAVREEQLTMGPLPDTNAIHTQYQSLDKRKFLEEWAIPKFPAVLDKYFLRQVGSKGDPKDWLAARTRWTRSVAAWSMTGYIVGLGDRHGENILVSSNNGECVHVDFAVLFDKGLTLKVPEIVPFRLTQNMVSAMGVAGYEGSFRVASEIVMSVLRGNIDALMGVLESFLHDPLADWTRGAGNGGRKPGMMEGAEGGDEGNNRYATEMMRAVEAKLRGVMDGSSLPLSIKGQVQRLIMEATSIENLSKMYLWWTAWC